MSKDKLSTEREVCWKRGYHDWQPFIDPKLGGYERCKDCGAVMDCEDPDGDSG